MTDKEFAAHLHKTSTDHLRLAEHHSQFAESHHALHTLHKSRAEALNDNGDLAGAKHHKAVAAIHKTSAAEHAEAASTHHLHAKHTEEQARASICARVRTRTQGGTKVVEATELSKLFTID